MDGLGVRMERREEARPIYHLITPSVKEKLEVTRGRLHAHTHEHTLKKGNVLWVLGALPLCPISPGVLMRLQLCWAGRIPTSVSCVCAVSWCVSPL